MKVLLVGAGAVGAVLGFHLARGGAEVTFLVRPSHRAELEGGIALYPANRKHPFAEPVMFNELAVTTSPDAGPWDYVVLCMSSPALRRGAWLDALVAVAGDATFVAIQGGIDDHAFVTARVPPERVVWGLFGMMSWFAEPEIDGVPRRGTAFWLPPRAVLPWSGPRARRFAETLTQGGLPAKVIPDAQRQLAFAGPLLEVHTLALECAGFEFKALRADTELMADAHAALADLGALGVAVHGGRPPAIYRILRPWMSRLVLRLAPRLVPFDIEAFFRRHYTKVGDQSLEGLRTKLAAARQRGLPAEGIARMLVRLEARRSAARP